ncbi:MAG: hypothetical protein Q4C53_08895 [Clostridia bacterium]|nr:hypothetical protein [Clostridia bacterium]
MEYIGTNEAAALWGVSSRQVRKWCADASIPGCVLLGKSWQIPAGTKKPADRRTRSGKAALRRNEHLEPYMNAEYCLHTAESCLTESDRILCDVHNTLLTGDLNGAFRKIVAFSDRCEAEYLLPALFLRFDIAGYLGETDDAVECYRRLAERIGTGEYPLTCLYLDLLRGTDDPSFATMDIPVAALPVFLYRHRRIRLIRLSQTEERPAVADLELYSKVVESMNNTEVTAYMHAQLAAYYACNGNDALHDLHAEKALAICLPRKWYLIIAEHSFFVDWKLGQRADKQTQDAVRTLAEHLSEHAVAKAEPGRVRCEDGYDPYLLLRISFLIVGDHTREEICEMLGLSMYQLKRYTAKLYRLAGTDNRKDFAAFWVAQLELM